MKIDPVCEMEVDVKKAKKEKLVLKKDGETLYFCCKDCLDKFKKDPTYTSIKCAECMKECNLEETLWKIKHKGKIYCFHSEKCKKNFQKKHFGGVIY